MMQVSSKAGEQQHSAAPQIEHQRRRECSPQVFCSILTRSLGPLGTLTVTREVAGALAHSINATQDCEILYHAIPCSTTPYILKAKKFAKPLFSQKICRKSA